MKSRVPTALALLAMLALASATGAALAQGAASFRDLPPVMVTPEQHAEAERERVRRADPDLPRLEALAEVESGFRATCPRHATGALDRHAHSVMAQWALSERPDLAVGYYEGLRLASMAACGPQLSQSRACARRYEAHAHDFHVGYVVQPGFLAWSAERRVRVGEALAADAVLMEARRSWPRLGERARLAAAKRMIALVAAGYDDAGVAVEVPEIVVVKARRGPRYTTFAHYNALPERITLRPRLLMAVTFERAFSIAQHETTHHVQRQLAKMVSEGGEGIAYLRRHGLEAEARLFRANLGTELYIEEDGRSRGKFAMYERNIVEINARMQEWDVLSLRDDGRTSVAADVAESVSDYREALERAARSRAEYCSAKVSARR